MLPNKTTIPPTIDNDSFFFTVDNVSFPFNFFFVPSLFSLFHIAPFIIIYFFCRIIFLLFRQACCLGSIMADSVFSGKLFFPLPLCNDMLRFFGV